MNEENEWNVVSSKTKERHADCTVIAEVIAALKKMKKHTASALSGLVSEMIQATADTGIQWLTDLCGGIASEGCIPEDWKSSVVLPIYKGRADPKECGSYTGIKLLEHATKWLKGSLKTELGTR